MSTETQPPKASRTHPFRITDGTLEALAQIPRPRSTLLGEALDNAYAQPSVLGNALARRARFEPGLNTSKVTITTPAGFMDKLNALSEQMGLSMDLTLRLAAEALLVERGVWEP